MISWESACLGGLPAGDGRDRAARRTPTPRHAAADLTRGSVSPRSLAWGTVWRTTLPRAALPNGDNRPSRWNRRRRPCQGGAVSSRADVAVIGGSGFYSFLDEPEQVTVATPYGEPSAPVSVGEVAGRRGGVPAAARAAPRVPAARDQLPRQPVGAAFARRPPGAGAVRGRRSARRGGAWRPRRAGPARRPHLGPDRRPTSSAARCTCPSPTPTAPGCRPPWPQPDGVRRGGTMVVIDGPRFSTRAESQDYAVARLDADQHDRCTRRPRWPASSRMCLATIALVTDMDAGVEPEQGVHQEDVFALFAGTPSGSRRCSPASSPTCPTRPAARATPGPTASSSPTRSREGPAHRRRPGSSARRSTASLADVGRRGGARRPDAARRRTA